MQHNDIKNINNYIDTPIALQPLNIYIRKRIKNMNEIQIKKSEIIEEIININFYILNAIREDNTQSVIKYKIMLDSLIKLYLKND